MYQLGVPEESGSLGVKAPLLDVNGEGSTAGGGTLGYAAFPDGHGTEDGLRHRKGKVARPPSYRNTKAKDFDSLDFEEVISPVTEAYLKSKSFFSHQGTAAARWVLNFTIGCVVAGIAVGIIYCTRKLTSIKFDIVYSLCSQEVAGTALPGTAFFAYLGFNLLYGLLATITVAYIEPAAGGSGIPEIKLILNGVKMPRITRFKTLVCRVVGNIFSVSSGCPVGYEGPMASIGGAVAAGLSQGKSSTLGIDTKFSVWKAFRNDREKRDFIVCGAGAGVAAAFNAPIGGVLFTYEEGASHWHKSLTWRAFFCCIVAAYVIDFVLSGITNGGVLGRLAGDAMMNFGSFANTKNGAEGDGSWGIWELPIFIGVGILGGLFGATFNAVNCAITKWRLSWIAAPQPPVSARSPVHSHASAGVGGASSFPVNGGGGGSGGGLGGWLKKDNSSSALLPTSSSSSAVAPGGALLLQPEGYNQWLQPQPKGMKSGYAALSDGATVVPTMKPSVATGVACWRRPSALRVWEVLGVVTVVSTTAFFAPLFFGTCNPRPSGGGNGGGYHSMALVSFYCSSDEFNDIASFWFAPQEEAIRLFYHFSAEAGNATQHSSLSLAPVVAAGNASGGGGEGEFNASASSRAETHDSSRLGSSRAAEVTTLSSSLSGLWQRGRGRWRRSISAASPSERETSAVRGVDPASRVTGGDTLTGGTPPFTTMHLGMFFFLYTALMCFTSGTAMPSGLFIPTLLSGSAMGRLVGELTNQLMPVGWEVDAGTYALIGSAAMLGGTTRMTISLAVILLECTGNFSYALPIMMALMSARWVGNLFNHGIYDAQIELRRWPLLEERVDKSMAYSLRACDVMVPQPIVFAEVEKVGRVVDVLTATAHNGFPVVFSDSMLHSHPRLGTMAGYIQRRQLAVLLAHRVFHDTLPCAPIVPPKRGQGGTPNGRLYEAGGAASTSAGAGRLHGVSSSTSTSTSIGGNGNPSSTLTDVFGGGRGMTMVSPPGLVRGGSFSTTSSLHRTGSSNSVQELAVSNVRSVIAAVGSPPSGRAGGGKKRSKGDKHSHSRSSGSILRSGEDDGVGHRRSSRTPSTGSTGSKDKPKSGGSSKRRQSGLLPRASRRSSSGAGAGGGYAPPSTATSSAAVVGGTTVAAESNEASPPEVVVHGIAGGKRHRSSGGEGGQQPPSHHKPPSGASFRASSPGTPMAAGRGEGGGSPTSWTGRAGSQKEDVRLRLPSVAPWREGGSSPTTAAAAAAAAVSPGPGVSPPAKGLRRSGSVPVALDHALQQATGTSPGGAGAEVEVGDRRLRSGTANTAVSAPPDWGASDGGTLLLPPFDVKGGLGKGQLTIATVAGGSTSSDLEKSRSHAAAMRGAGAATTAGSHLRKGGQGNMLIATPPRPTPTPPPVPLPPTLAPEAEELEAGYASSGSGVGDTAHELYNSVYSQEYRYEEEPQLEAADFDFAYPRFPDVASMTFSALEREQYIDLRPYMDPTPITAHVHTPLTRTFRLFRSLGLRHLCVINNSNDIVGIITRHELSHEYLAERLRTVKMGEAVAAATIAAARARAAAAAQDLDDSGGSSSDGEEEEHLVGRIGVGGGASALWTQPKQVLVRPTSPPSFYTDSESGSPDTALKNTARSAASLTGLAS